MVKNRIFIISFLSILSAQKFTIARIHYSGGGDWYSDPSSLPNLLEFVQTHTSMSVNPEEVRLKLTDADAGYYPYLYLTGHGNIRFTDDEVIALRSMIMNGAFLHADDNYGMDQSFRREMKRVFPNKDLIPLPHNHPIFSSYFISILFSQSYFDRIIGSTVKKNFQIGDRIYLRDIYKNSK